MSAPHDAMGRRAAEVDERDRLVGILVERFVAQYRAALSELPIGELAALANLSAPNPVAEAHAEAVAAAERVHARCEVSP